MSMALEWCTDRAAIDEEERWSALSSCGRAQRSGVVGQAHRWASSSLKRAGRLALWTADSGGGRRRGRAWCSDDGGGGGGGRGRGQEEEANEVASSSTRKDSRSVTTTKRSSATAQPR